MWSEEDGTMIVEISGERPSWQVGAMFVWVLLWITCGIVVIWQLSSAGLAPGLKLTVYVYLVFWLYFCVKSVRSLLWRLYGVERIKANREGVVIKRDVKGYGEAKTYFAENMKQFQLLDAQDKSFGKVYSQSFWVITGETMMFEYMGKQIRFAHQIEPQSAKFLHKKITQLIR